LSLSRKIHDVVVASLACGAALGILLAYLSLRRSASDQTANQFEWASLIIVAGAFTGWVLAIAGVRLGW
jgi:NhaP-type Na+/H+ or K+/H+ antiporter